MGSMLAKRTFGKKGVFEKSADFCFSPYFFVKHSPDFYFKNKLLTPFLSHIKKIFLFTIIKIIKHDN